MQYGSKKARIMALWGTIPDSNPSKTTIIAKKVGCLPEYVRVVVRQRKGGGQSPTDHRYWIRRTGAESVEDAWRLDARERYADPRQRALHLARMARYRARRAA
jgi:hypothetical protein